MRLLPLLLLTAQKCRGLSTLTIRSPRLYAPQALTPSTQVLLDASQSRYLARVMRVREGDAVRLFDGLTGEYEAVVDTVHKGRRGKGRGEDVVTLDVRGMTRSLEDKESSSSATLLFAPIRKARAKILIEKVVELGVTMLVPVVTERTQEKLDQDDMSKLRAVIIEAAEQSERLTVPQLMDPEPLSAVLSKWEAATPLLLCSERKSAPPLLDALGRSDNAAFLVGPEGGFSDAEFKLLEALQSVQPVSLGPNILRAETACVYVLSCWNARSLTKPSQGKGGEQKKC
ncbi:unnamed protein product [Chrysoparadoxa australica]